MLSLAAAAVLLEPSLQERNNNAAIPIPILYTINFTISYTNPNILILSEAFYKLEVRIP